MADEVAIRERSLRRPLGQHVRESVGNLWAQLYSELNLPEYATVIKWALRHEIATWLYEIPETYVVPLTKTSYV